MTPVKETIKNAKKLFLSFIFAPPPKPPETEQNVKDLMKMLGKGKNR